MQHQQQGYVVLLLPVLGVGGGGFNSTRPHLGPWTLPGPLYTFNSALLPALPGPGPGR